ncbi:hypothetical protein ABT336_11780 [Micromonospora sp. NPDC000207]|uniref:hypothetical protein n=1 Tax=Micromonospora sp. NPDC000207 TaxID=3154246 RepID=UPI00331F44A0
MKPTRLAAALTAATLTACGSQPVTTPEPAATTPPPLLIRGDILVPLPHFRWDKGQGCWGAEQHADLRQDARVTITDNTGTTVAMGKLELGSVTMNPADRERAQLCTFTFRIEGVPAGGQFYTVTAGNVTEQFPAAELAQPVRLHAR